jgi:hypothetical protein
MVDPINSVLETAHQKLGQLLAERSKIDKAIVDWKRVIDSLLAVSESEDADPSDVEVSAFVGNETGTRRIKFTDGVRLVLRQNASREIPISVPEIREQLINLGFDFAKYAQPLVPIHNTLKRLEDQREVFPIKNDQGQTLGYRWISPIERALNEENVQPYANAYAGLVSGEMSTSLDATPLPADHPLRKLRRTVPPPPGSAGAAFEALKIAHELRKK